MKKLLLGLMVVISAQQTLAKAREFRILTGSTSGDVAIAWGVKGAMTDFEAYDLKSEDEQFAFYDRNADKIENYLVDLKTMKVLSVLREGATETLMGPILEFSNKMNTNHNSLNMVYDAQAGIAVVTGGTKWFSGLQSLVAIKTDGRGQNQVIGKCDQECETKIIDPAARAQMTPAQKKDLDQYDAANTTYELTQDKEGRSMWKVTFSTEEIKGEGYAAYTGNMRLKFENGKFKAVFSKFKKGQ